MFGKIWWYIANLYREETEIEIYFCGELYNENAVNDHENVELAKRMVEFFNIIQ